MIDWAIALTGNSWPDATPAPIRKVRRSKVGPNFEPSNDWIDFIGRPNRSILIGLSFDSTRAEAARFCQPFQMRSRS